MYGLLVFIDTAQFYLFSCSIDITNAYFLMFLYISNVYLKNKPKVLYTYQTILVRYGTHNNRNKKSHDRNAREWSNILGNYFRTGSYKERCVAYLKGILPKENQMPAITKEWQAAEQEAKEILTEMGFVEIHNLNDLCSFPPYWDYLAKQDNQWWLVDVTINGQKSIAAKRDSMVYGYEHAILLKSNNNEWKLIKIEMKVIKSHIAE